MRRFNPEDETIRDLISEDEGGRKQYTLKTGAFTGFSDGGCSLGRKGVLRKAGLTVNDFLHPKFRAIAQATAAQILKFTHLDSANVTRHPFSIAADAYPDDEPYAAWQVAHAVMKLNDGFKSGAARKSALGTLARSVFRALPVDPAGDA